MPNLKGVTWKPLKLASLALLGSPAWLGWAQRWEPWVGDAWYELSP